MTLLEEIEHHFGVKNLYDVLGVEKEASSAEIKKAYRKVSLKVHPDRADASMKEEATKRFQVLAQVHFILDDAERRKLYDDHGIIHNEDKLDESNWEEYWRLLFPKVTEKDIKSFMDTYVGSKEEEADLIALYNRYEGDLDKLSETHISYDEERTPEHLNKLIADKKIEALDKFVNEPESRRAKRLRKVQREAKQAEKARKSKKLKVEDDDMSELTALIKKKSQNTFDSMIASLEAKYANKSSSKDGGKRKRKNR